jgi:hypothetical protein
MNPFTTRNSQGLLNSTQTRGPPVRPVRPTGQTGVAVAGLATRRPTGQTVEGHQSDRWCQPDRPCAKFGCEQRFGEPLPHLLFIDTMSISSILSSSPCCCFFFVDLPLHTEQNIYQNIVLLIKL